MSNERARATVEGLLTDALRNGPLDALRLSAELSQEVDRQQRCAVREAVEHHSWSEIGAALGVSKQAAHRKFVASVADQVRTEHAKLKAAKRAGRTADASTARESLQGAAEVLKKTRHLS